MQYNNHGWAFTIPQFARMYAKKWGCDEKTLIEKFWGDHFYDPLTKKWYDTADGIEQRFFWKFLDNLGAKNFLEFFLVFRHIKYDEFCKNLIFINFFIPKWAF